MEAEQPEALDEEARVVLRNRVKDIHRTIDELEAHLTTGSLYHLESDLQLLEAQARVTAEQLLRVIRETGELRQAGLRDLHHDEVGDQRERHEQG